MQQKQSSTRSLTKGLHMMTNNEYQLRAHSFADYTQPFVSKDGKNITVDYTYPALGLAEEAGEAAGKFAKAIRDNGGVIDDKRKEEIVKELGDVLWMVAELCTILNVSVSEVMEKNISKLESRRERGKIHGSGDNR